MTLVSVLLMWFLLAWAYSRALVGALARVMEIGEPDHLGAKVATC